MTKCLHLNSSSSRLSHAVVCVQDVSLLLGPAGKIRTPAKAHMQTAVLLAQLHRLCALDMSLMVPAKSALQ